MAAVDVATAQRALDLIKVEYSELPAYFTADAARAEGAVLLHDDKPGNIERDVEFDLGDVDKGMAEADLVRADSPFLATQVAQMLERNRARVH